MHSYFFKLPSIIVCISLFLLAEAKPTSGIYTTSRLSTVEFLLKTDSFNQAAHLKYRSVVTAYCTNACCNSGYLLENGNPVLKNWSNKIAAGNISMQALFSAGIHFAAVDPAVIPYGSVIIYKGEYYVALDKGSRITGTDIDLGMITHSEAEHFGRRLNEEVEAIIPKDSRHSLKLVLDYAGKYEKTSHP